jgi:hypothetical protein
MIPKATIGTHLLGLTQRPSGQKLCTAGQKSIPKDQTSGPAFTAKNYAEGNATPNAQKEFS